MNSKCSFIYVDKLIVNHGLDCRGTRKTANTHDFVIKVGYKRNENNVEFVEHNALHIWSID